MFQPASYTGYGGAHFGPHDPLDVITIPDIVRAAEEQTGGLLRRTDFLPLAVLAPRLLRAHVHAPHGRGLHPLPPLHRPRPLSGGDRQPRHHPARRDARDRAPRDDRRAVVELRPD